jgi:hypothetical protein
MKYYAEKSLSNDCGSDFVLQDKIEDVDFYENISREMKFSNRIHFLTLFLHDEKNE